MKSISRLLAVCLLGRLIAVSLKLALFSFELGKWHKTNVLSYQPLKWDGGWRELWRGWGGIPTAHIITLFK